MKKKINVEVEIQIDQENDIECSAFCSYLHNRSNYCILFKKDIMHYYDDNYNHLFYRCNQCYEATK